MVENNAVIIGRLTADVEIRTIRETENRVADFTVAVNRPKRRDAEGKADFIRVRAWNSTADFIEKYFAKGSKIGIRGSIRVDSYENKEGEHKTFTYISADEVCFIESKHSSEENGETQQIKTSTKKSNVNVSYDDVDTDDLPF